LSFRDGSNTRGEVFEVTNVKPDGVARVVVHVVQLGRPKDSQDGLDWRNALQQSESR
jgi:hypothetical protein